MLLYSRFLRIIILLKAKSVRKGWHRSYKVILPLAG